MNITKSNNNRERNMPRIYFFVSAFLVVSGITWSNAAMAQSDVAFERIESRSVNIPLDSLALAAQEARSRRPVLSGPREVPNFRGEGPPIISGGGPAVPDAVLQTSQGSGATATGSGFPGASNDDNAAIVGGMVAPPDTDGEVGASHFVQMINLLTTIYGKDGSVAVDSFQSDAFWSGIGGNCEAYNSGDPVVLYDETADRWLVSQFAFPSNLNTFSQCVAISQTGDPTGGFNRYEFSFDNIGFNDYPKHGIVSDSITMMANLFRKRGPFFNFSGTFLGVMDKAAMYAGNDATLIGFNIGNGEFGFVAGDLDGSGSAPALFGTAMSSSNAFDIWQIDNINWSAGNASVNQVASVPITPFDGDLCAASREACIPQPDGGPSLEAMSDRLMHRLQIRDFGAYRTMVASHAVDVGSGRAGIRWYELRESGGTWSLYQEGTFGPSDGLHRWMSSAAMNAAGDIGIGYLVSSDTHYVSTAVAGQSAASSGSGMLDSGELVCAPGTGIQGGTARTGDYSSTSVDPVSDSFWHTNEVFVESGNFKWSTFVCEFSVGSGGPGNTPPTALFSSNCTDLACSFADQSVNGNGTIDTWSWDFGDGNSADIPNPSHTYAASGDYDVTLTVTDDLDESDSDVQTLSVSDGLPVASFTSSCTNLTCDFTDTSTDVGGGVVAWAWDFGDGNTSSAQNPSNTYASAGTYTVTLIASDGAGNSDNASNDVSVSEASPISLTVLTEKIRGEKHVDLSWAGANSANVDIVRDGNVVATTANSGSWSESLGKGGGVYVYQVCETDGGPCSDTATASF